MITKLYTFYDTPFDHHVCHLFEHAVIRSFLFKLQEKGHGRAFFGWLRGQTIDSTIFFDLGAHSSEIAVLFNDHLETLTHFDRSIISQSLAHIEAEMECIIEITDEVLLTRQLEQLCQLVNRADTHLPASSTENPLTITHRSDLFEEIVILINVFSTSDETQKSFLGLHPVILDIIRDAAIDEKSIYPTGKSALAINDEGIGIAWRLNAKKDIDIDALQSNTEAYLEQLDLADYINQTDMYRKSFSEDFTWSSKPIEFYEQTGIQTTREELAKLATNENLEKTLCNMTVRFTHLTDKLKKLEWNY